MKKKMKFMKKIMAFSLSCALITTSLSAILSYSGQAEIIEVEAASDNSADVVTEIANTFDFEPIADVGTSDVLDGFYTLKGTFDLSTEYNHTTSGVQSFALIGTDAVGQMDIGYNFEEQTGKEVSAWIYDDLESTRTVVMQLSESSPATGAAYYQVYIGIKDNKYQAYIMFVDELGAKTYYNAASPITVRTEGWHEFAVDMTEAGKIFLYVDGTCIGSYIDGTSIAGSTNLDETDGYATFNKLAFVNFWTSSMVNTTAYVDDISITELAPVPSDLEVDDVNNTLDWTYADGETNIADYEYSIDGGVTYYDCLEKPVYIGNVNLDSGDVMLRVKTASTVDYVYPSISSSVAFTYSTEQSNDFESSSDLLSWTANSITDMDLTTLYSRSGLSGLSVESAGTVTTEDTGYVSAQFQISQTFNETITDKVVSIWYYEDLEYHQFLVVPSMDGGNTDARIGIGAVNSTSTSYFYYRDFTGGVILTTTVERTEGWHNFVWDYSEEGKVTLYIDDEEIYSTTANGFNKVEIFDYWSNSGNKSPAYFDDFEILSSMDEIIEILDAPTNSVVDDEADTFEWTWVPGYEDISLYEYSTDDGATFEDCTSNPQIVPSTTMSSGTVMVRLKATATTEAGAVLRSAERYTPPGGALAETIVEQIEFISYANPADYTEESWDNLQEAVEVAEIAATTLENIQTAYDELLDAIEALVFDLDNEVVYTFADQVVPVDPVYGTVDWSTSSNVSYITDQAYKIIAEDVDGIDVAELNYTFPSGLEEKQIVFYYIDQKDGGMISFTMGNQEDGTGMVFESSGTGDYDSYYMYFIEDGELTNATDSDMRRRDELTKVEINMTADGGTQLYVNSILVMSNPNLDSIDYLNFQVTGEGTTVEQYLFIDELSIIEKNEVLDIILPEESVEIGYYDTYEINYINAEYETPYDYDTTDKFSYYSDNTSVATVTTGGSIQSRGVGTANVTVTSSSGATETIAVEVKDYSVEGVELNDSLVTQEANYLETLTMTPGTIEILNAVITPSGATNLTKTWTSSNEDVATVIDGEITAHLVGTTVITVTTEDGNKTDSVTVYVEEERTEYAMEIFVSTDGDDYTGDGSIEAPFASVERARDEIRATSQVVDGGVIVYFREGNYSISESVELKSQDSGSEENPVVYASYEDEEVIFSGGLALSPSEFTLTTETEIVAKLQDEAVGEVYEVDITDFLEAYPLDILAEGYSNYLVSAAVQEAGYNNTDQYYSLTYDGSSMTLAQWPNADETVSGSSYAGYTRINTVVYSGQSLRYWQDDIIGTVNYIEEDRDLFDSFAVISNALTTRMETWEGIPFDTDIVDLDIWYSGYTGVDYTTQSSPISYIDGDTGAITSYFATIYWAYANAYNRIYVYNLIQELDIPGEWYIDSDSGKLYIIPPTGTEMDSTDELFSIAILSDTMFTLTNANYITIDGVTMTNTLGGVFDVYGGSYNKLSNTTISNTSSSIGGVWDSDTEYATYSGIEYCTVVDVNGGFTLSGNADYENLTAGNNFVHGCYFSNYSTLSNGFNPAVTINGVGNVASSNEICNSPNNAIMWQGNDHVIEFNEIYSVDLETTDTSAIYTGRSVLNRGTVIKNNYFHNIGVTESSSSANSAIYIDDVAGGITIYDNVFEDLYWGVFINGGQVNYVTNNTFIDCKYAVVANDWSYCWTSRWYQHAYGLLANSSTLAATTIDWYSEDSAYAKYDNFQTVLDGEDMNDSIYNKVINNTIINTTLYNYMDRDVQANATSVISGWFFTKDNN